MTRYYEVKLGEEKRYFRFRPRPENTEVVEIDIDKLNSNDKLEWRELDFTSTRETETGIINIVKPGGEAAIELYVPKNPAAGSMTFSIEAEELMAGSLVEISFGSLPDDLQRLEQQRDSYLKTQALCSGFLRLPCNADVNDAEDFKKFQALGGNETQTSNSVAQLDSTIRDDPFQFSEAQTTQSDDLRGNESRSSPNLTVRKSHPKREELSPKQNRSKPFLERLSDSPKPQYSKPIVSQEPGCDACSWLNMRTLGLFIGAIGVGAVFIAIAALNVLSMGTPAGIVAAGFGIVAGLVGLGLFCRGVYDQNVEPDELDEGYQFCC